jgi:hypothetical protein
VFAFDVTYREAEAANAERAFLRRSTKELRLLYNFTFFVILPLLLASAYFFKAPRWVSYTLIGLLVASIALPVFFYFARPAEAKRLARRFPMRHVELGPEGVGVTAGGGRGVVPWTQIRHVWTIGDSVFLVLSAYIVLTIPLHQLPEGAYDYMLAASKSPPNKSLERTREG